MTDEETLHDFIGNNADGKEAADMHKVLSRLTAELARLQAAEARVKELERRLDEAQLDGQSAHKAMVKWRGDAERLRLAAEKAVEAMESAACDVEAYTKVEYEWPNVHPSQKVKFERDMAHVAEIRAARAGLMEAMENGG